MFAIKLLAEKAIICDNYEIHLLMLDMSKAFDTVDRTTLLKFLQEILDPDELFLINLLINDFEYQVRIGKTIGEIIKTKRGIAQGDC